ncbi:MAG: hypothetical protein PHY48_02945 [Candidatus Cloacimonetes bacterium]|nr:hypothetical protein [Candidatus Cloacimonadota bacterium]
MIINEKTIPTYDLDVLRKKMAYVNCIDIALTEPHEIWYHPDDETTYYLLRIEGDVTFVATVKDDIFQGFDVIEKDNDTVDALRCGVLKFASMTGTV